MGRVCIVGGAGMSYVNHAEIIAGVKAIKSVNQIIRDAKQKDKLEEKYNKAFYRGFKHKA